MTALEELQKRLEGIIEVTFARTKDHKDRDMLITSFNGSKGTFYMSKAWVEKDEENVDEKLYNITCDNLMYLLGDVLAHVGDIQYMSELKNSISLKDKLKELNKKKRQKKN